MPVRDWDKLKRQDRARNSSSPPGIMTRRLRKARRKWANAKNKFVPPKTFPKPKKHVPILRKRLHVTTPTYSATAVFTRTRGSWRCTEADPPIEWMLRAVNPETVAHWIDCNHFSHHWSSCDMRPVAQPPADR